MERFSAFIGMSLEEISWETGNFINHKSKSFLQQFISELLGIKGTSLNQIEEFANANIIVKTVRLEPNGMPQNHMSFKNIDFIAWAKEDWDGSWLKNHFEETKFLFVVFQYKETKLQDPDRQLYFNGVKLWSMPVKDIDGHLNEFWSHVQSLISNGIELTPVQIKTKIIVRNNLPKPGNNGLCHIRPKAINGNDKTSLPDGQQITRQAFWLDKEYIGSLTQQLDGETPLLHVNNYDKGFEIREKGETIMSTSLDDFPHFPLDIQAQVIHAYLVEARSHRRIQEEILKIEAPARGGGFITMQILHHYEIDGQKKGALKINSFENEFSEAKGLYKRALEILNSYKND